ncbi:MAG: PAS domain S-box protein [Acidobacteria bacterium]|nr:PAS domain S-box protein [Acidobacteriota bacterium]
MTDAQKSLGLRPRSEDLFRFVAENVEDFAIFTIDLDGTLGSWNPGVEKLLGYAEAEWVGRNSCDIFTPEDNLRDACGVEMRTAAESGRAEDERWHLRKDGTRFWANGLLMALRDENGEMYCFAKIMRDETRKKNAVEERERFLGVGTDLLVVTGFDGRFKWVSPAWERTFGWTAKELTEHPWLYFVHPDDHERTISEAEKLFAGQETVSFENRYLHRDGSYRWLVWNTKSYPQEGVLYASAIDVTGRHRKELTLRFLVDLNQATQPLTDPDEIMAVTARMLGEHLGVNRCAYAEVETDEDHFVIKGDYTRDTFSIVGRYRMSSFGADALSLSRANVPYVVENAETDARVGANLATYRQTGIAAVVSVPLHREGRFVAGMAVHQKTPRRWTSEEVELIRLVVNRCWESIERARAIRRFSEGQARFRFLAESMPQKIFTATPAGEVDYFNRQWMEFTGLTFEQIKDWGWTQFIHPDDVEENVRRWKHSLDTGEPFQLEHRFRRADGAYHWHLSRAHAMRDAEGKVLMWIGSNTDIHDVKRAEEALKESEEQFRLFAQTATDAIINIDAASRILFINKAAEGIFGYSHADMQGSSLTMLMPDYLRHLHQAGMNRYLKTGQKHVSWESVEVPGLHRDGRAIPLEISFGEYTRGGERYFTGICRDISERKRVQLRLNAQHSVTRILAEAETVAEASARIIQAVCESLGWDVGEIWRLHPDENHLRCAEGWHGPFVTDEVFAEMCGINPLPPGVGMPGRVWSSGEPVWITDIAREENFPRARIAQRAGLRSAFAFPVKLGAEVIGVMEFFSREVRERDEEVIEMIATLGSQMGQFIERRNVERARAELLALERASRTEAEEANRLKDEFLATLSHELRTPLTSILGWARLLQTNNFDEAAMRRALETIERNARAQNQLVDDLLDTSRIITGKLRLDVRSVDLADVVTAATDSVRPAAEAKEIRLQTLLDPQAGPVSGDPDRLQQVVWNLVSNAIKFTPKRGRVQVRLERVNSHIEITVADTGMGIAPEFLPHVFDRFRQADQATTRAHGGLGLGLAIVRQLVELHGGTVSAHSDGKGQGTTFTINLPLLPVRQEPASDLPRVHPAARGGIALTCPPELDGLRVLIVDDEADTRDLLLAVLTSCGAQVTLTASAAEALEQIGREHFDVLVTDIGMPEEDGYSLIEKVRMLPAERGGTLPAAALTAYARMEDRVRALRSGFQIHVPKPVDPTELITVVANLAGRTGNGK